MNGQKWLVDVCARCTRRLGVESHHQDTEPHIASAVFMDNCEKGLVREVDIRFHVHSSSLLTTVPLNIVCPVFGEILLGEGTWIIYGVIERYVHFLFMIMECLVICLRVGL